MTHKPLKIGLLLSKSDDDIIKEVMTDYCNYFDTIFCIEASDDERKSYEIIKSFGKVEYIAHKEDLGVDTAMLKDGVRQLLLSRIQDKYGYDGWIFPIHSDEVFWGNPASLIDCAVNEGANILNAMIAHFVFHSQEEIDGTVLENRYRNVVDRRLWYFLGQCENCGFKNQRGLYYNFFEHMRTIPHGFYPTTACSKVIIRRHYNMRTSEQLKKRIEDRVKTGWQPAYKSIPDKLYIEDPKEIITAGAVYSGIEKFDGEFKIPEEWKARIVR
ncbi:MAG: hypothetical protein QME51_06160 [Planctomycetota bacterium]|nr:hypothetical protein [Planctomycetota bacterium]